VSGKVDVFGSAFNVVAQTFNLAAASFVWVAARGRRFSNTAVLYLGLGLEVMLCLVAASAGQLWFYRDTGAPMFISWCIPIVILFPVIVPCPPRIMLVASIAAASMEPLAALGLWSQGVYPLETLKGTLPGTLISPTLAVIIAYVASRIIYGLNVDVAKAKQMGSYHLESLLGRGGMGEVWRAKHRMLARPAAIKLIRPDAVGTDEAAGHTLLQRFEREAQATASLRSPHTVEIYDFGLSKDGTFFYVMELLDGIDLDTLVKEHGPIPAERVVHVLRQVCHSLDEAHEAGLTHRDIKPANLFICRYGRENDFVKVLDFGLVKKHRATDEDRGDLTQHGTAVGTPTFMAPEMLWDGGPVDGRADIYALGCVAYWLLTGLLVFEGPSAMAVIVSHARDIPELPSARSELDIPPALERIVMECLEKEPTNRPQSATELAGRLDKVVFDNPWTSESAAKWWERHLPAPLDAGKAQNA
jgi:serine/threonine-protein kinase